jgi:polyphosphate kinase
MYRNLSRRVEAAAPVADRGHRQRLWDILDVGLRDRRSAWVMCADGTYEQLQPQPDGEGPETIGSHAALIETTRRRFAAPAALTPATA